MRSNRGNGPCRREIATDADNQINIPDDVLLITMTLLEVHIERAVRDMLEHDGWRVFKMEQNFSEKKIKTTGERGMPDLLCIRYGYLDYCEERGADCCHVAEVVWIEMKRMTKSGKPTKAARAQRDWHTLERKRGALTLIAGEDFPASIESFKDWYLKSGLNRSMLP